MAIILSVICNQNHEPNTEIDLARNLERTLKKAKLMPEQITETDLGPSASRQTLSRKTWINAARNVLELRGIAEVKIDRLARQFKVTRGSFYFHFSSLKDLHSSLLDEWRRANCAPFQAMRDTKNIDGLQFFSDIVHVWVDENPFRPNLDLAVRNWSRTSTEIAKEVEEIDELRIALLIRAFRDIGYSGDESLVRARLTYLHQIGHYVLSFEEDPEVRRRYQPVFGAVLLGPLVKDPEI